MLYSFYPPARAMPAGLSSFPEDLFLYKTMLPYPGNNCAYYDLTDKRLTEDQRFILDGGVWGSDGLAVQHGRLARLEQLRAEHSDKLSTGTGARL